jgi:hypothetical protein
MKNVLVTFAAGLLLTACHKSNNNNVLPQPNAPTPQTHAAQKSDNGVAGAMAAYYDATLFKINLMELSDKAAAQLIAHNGSINVIYESDQLVGGQMFIAVLDAIQGDGFNPLWQEQLITFTAGHTPRQLFSDDEISDAVASGEITLTVTDEVYRCSVIGKP